MAANILAIIPARGGSKRLPGKNIKELDGRPLIAYSVLVAKYTRSINHVLVATDSDDIWREAERHDANMIVRLPSELTGDTASLSDSLKHVMEFNLQFSRRLKGQSIDWVVLLQPTCPLRLPSLLDHWIGQVLADNECDGALTVDRSNYKLGTTMNVVDNYYIPCYEPMTPKQNVKPTLRENGVFYIFRAENVLKGKPWSKMDKMIPIECPREQSLANIDDAFDWGLTETLYFKHAYDNLFGELEQRYAQRN